MTSSTVLRVKRRLEDNPQDALVLLCKRRKTDEEISPALFVFRGSVDSQDTTPIKTIVPKISTKLKSATAVDDIINKMRQEKKDTASENRYKVVRCSRAIKDDDNLENEFDMVDLQKTSEELEDVKCTFDLYTPAKDDFDISLLDNLVSIENYETELIFANNRGPDEAGSDGEQEDDDDSNDENNWRNDYPDSDPSSIDEEDMIKAMQKCDIEDDLSSDAGQDKVYEDTLDLSNEDVKRYGFAYAKYKAKVQNEDTSQTNSNNYVHCSKVKDLDEETIEGYKDDSDDGFYYGQEEDSMQFRGQDEEQESSEEFSPD